MTKPSSTSRFKCMSCQTRNGCSVAIVAPTTPTDRDATRRPISSTTTAVRAATAMCAMPDDEPVPLEDLVEAREEPRVQGLRVAGGPAWQEPERPARDQGLREAVALLDQLLEDLALARRRGRLPAGRPPRPARSRSPGRVSSRLGGEIGRSRDGCVEPRALPELEHEQAPQPVAVIALSTSRARRAGASTTLGCSCSRARVRASRSVSPASSRKGPRNQAPSGMPKPVFPREASSAGIEIRERTPKRDLPAPTLQTEGVGERDAELEHLVVEKRRPELERRRHRGPVGLHEQVVGKVGPRVEPLQACDSTARAGRRAGSKRVAEHRSPR